MRVMVAISSLELPRPKLADISRLYPEGAVDHCRFATRLPRDDPRTKEVLNWLEREGYRPWNYQGTLNYAHEYMLTFIREYEPSDFERAEYAEFWPVDIMDRVLACDRDERGYLTIERPTLKDARLTGMNLVSATYGRILVLEHVRDILLEGDFRHLLFRPTVLVKGRGTGPGRATTIPWEDFKVSKPWWELTSDLVLPPLSPSMDLRDDKGNPIPPGDCSKGCSPRDGFYNHAERRYRRGDLAKVDLFDVALTFENFGTRGHTETRGTIVSKRFYDYCVQKRLNARWAPVRIDED